CSINVTSTPTVGGSLTGNLTIRSNAAGSPQTLPLSGAGSTGGSPAASLSLTAVAFGSEIVGSPSIAQTVTLSNSGTASLSITSIAITGTNSADYAQTNNCGSSVAAGSSCNIYVTFSPTAVGTRSASLTVTDNDSG